MIDLINTYMPEIMVVLAVLTPLMPTIIMRVLSDKRLQDTFSNFKVSGALSVEAASKLTQEVLALEQNTQFVKNLVGEMEDIKKDYAAIGSKFMDAKESVDQALELMKIATEQLRQKDLTIQYLHQELKHIRSKLGVR
jgi:16S rRNA G966 N2-methylase RsmD